MSRYGAIFVVGVVCNIIGDAIGRPMWYTDCGNTVYQMFYVLVIIMLAFFAWPLRATLRDDAEPFGGTSSVRWLSNYASDRALTLALYSTLWLATAACYFSGVDILSILEEWDPLFSQSSWTMYIRDIIRNIFFLLAHAFGFAAITALFVYLRRDPAGWPFNISWLILFYIYLPPTLMPMNMAYGPHAVMLYLLGVVVAKYPFYGERAIARTFQSYGLLVVVVLLILPAQPLLKGRCDIFVPPTYWERIRFYFGEAVLAVLLLTKSLVASDPYRWVQPLGWWALFAFTTHVALARALPMSGGGSHAAFFTEVGLIPLFMLAFAYVPALSARTEPRDSSGEEVPLEPGLGFAQRDFEKSEAKAPPYGTFGALFSSSSGP